MVGVCVYSYSSTAPDWCLLFLSNTVTLEIITLPLSELEYRIVSVGRGFFVLLFNWQGNDVVPFIFIYLFIFVINVFQFLKKKKKLRNQKKRKSKTALVWLIDGST